MKLSDAIDIGRVTIEKWTLGHLEGCALGMAANAVGCEYSYSDIEKHWPWITEHPGKCPLCNRVFFYPCDTTMMLIAHLFDTHVMDFDDITLDQLIDWVRSVEPAEDVPGNDGALAAEAAHAEVCEKELTAVTHGRKT